MPSSIALFITLAFIAWLFRRDYRTAPQVTGALWIPFFWVFISGSRFVTQWLDIIGLNLGGTSVDEGSPIDAFIFFGLIAVGVYILHRRRVNVAEFVRSNQWVVIYLAYCFLSSLWSDTPFIAFKRWIKLFGQPVMVLIVLTEPDPLASLVRLFKRCAYVFIPLSILFIRYFPNLGIGFDQWTGSRMNTGVTYNKNILGCDCMILATFLFWHLLQVRQQEKSQARRQELISSLFFLGLTCWTLLLAHSSTSIGAFVVAIALMLFLGQRFVNVRRIGTYFLGFLIIGALAEGLFGIHELAFKLLGRDTTFTGRTQIWSILMHWDLNPILGAGFESFWINSRINQLEAMLPGLTANEAHNGYLEIYINTGLLGLAITAGLLAATYAKARRALIDNFDFGRLRMAYLFAFIIYNSTEAAFRTHTFPFFMFFLIAIDYHRPSSSNNLPRGSDVE
jgi:O-antigen ligase